MLAEINFDGIVGPTHNFAGLSFGNLAATAHAGLTSHPRAAALQGLAKMRRAMALGLHQGFFVPPPRPNMRFLEALHAGPESDSALTAAAWSASAMWAANAATISPAPDTADGRCHITPANLITMPHRSHEWPDTARQLALAFADPAHFAHHPPVPPCFGDEGAANHMRLCPAHDAPGLEIFVHGRSGGPFPARQHAQAGRAIARAHRLAEGMVLHVEQSPEAIAAGAFHNDVVAVANGPVLMAHEQAFADLPGTCAAIRERLPQAELVIVPAAEVSLADAVRSYLFNAQLVSLPGGGMALIVPTDAQGVAPVAAWLERLLRSNGPIRAVHAVDVRQSMANGGGPACLRLRVVADPAAIDPRFMLTQQKADAIERIIAAHWPESIAPQALGSAQLAETALSARAALLHALGLAELA